MSDLLNQIAIRRKDGDDAQELLGAYLNTNPDMALNHTQEAAAAPAAPAAARAPGPAGPGGARSGVTAGFAGDLGTSVARGPEYEVFRNSKDALAFFLYRQGALDGLSDDGPFWFQVRGNTILAGNDKHQIIFENLSDELIGVSMRRGVIMLVEFENQKAARCTPCYLTDSL